jgi:hypothetical protein
MQWRVLLFHATHDVGEVDHGGAGGHDDAVGQRVLLHRHLGVLG